MHFACELLELQIIYIILVLENWNQEYLSLDSMWDRVCASSLQKQETDEVRKI